MREDNCFSCQECKFWRFCFQECIFLRHCSETQDRKITGQEGQMINKLTYKILQEDKINTSRDKYMYTWINAYRRTYMHIGRLIDKIWNKNRHAMPVQISMDHINWLTSNKQTHRWQTNDRPIEIPRKLKQTFSNDSLDWK